MNLEGFRTMNDIAREQFAQTQIVDIARVCHEANRTYCKTIGDNSQVEWAHATQDQRESAFKGVEFCLNNPDLPPSANHESWLVVKREQGWKYGPIKDEAKKEHPCFVPYDQLPEEQKAKDALFKMIVFALAPYLTIAAKAA